MHFGYQLMKAMTESGLSQSDFARKFGVSRQRVHLMLQQEKAYESTIQEVLKILPEFDERKIQNRGKCFPLKKGSNK